MGVGRSRRTAMSDRFTPEHLDTWRRDGGLVIENFFTPDEVAAVVADFELLFGDAKRAAESVSIKTDGEIGRFNPDQFKGIKPVPVECSPALNLIGVHPALIAF